MSTSKTELGEVHAFDILQADRHLAECLLNHPNILEEFTFPLDDRTIKQHQFLELGAHLQRKCIQSPNAFPLKEIKPGL